MTLAQIRAKWEARQVEANRLGATVSLAAIANDVLEDLGQIELAGDADSLTLDEASRESGYSTDHLRHLIADGTLANAGRKHAPRLRRVDLPRKPSAVRAATKFSKYNADRDAIQKTAGENSR
jgi:hypothetical protein